MMPLDLPYYVVESRRFNEYASNRVEYAICSSADGTLVTGTDLAFMHHVVDLLNEDVRTSCQPGSPTHPGSASSEDHSSTPQPTTP
jgi:hypothetical protein